MIKKSLDSSDQDLIDQLRAAIQEVNRCSEQLAKERIFAYFRLMTRGPDQGDRIEMYDLILYKSLLADQKKSPKETANV